MIDVSYSEAANTCVASILNIPKDKVLCHNVVNFYVVEKLPHLLLASSGCGSGGGGEIRTHGRVTPTAVFKTAALNRSATPPITELIELQSYLLEFFLASYRVLYLSIELAITHGLVTRNIIVCVFEASVARRFWFSAPILAVLPRG